ncbi:radical SAM protein [bacterium]|nr:radical SAM protein [bacterium]
MSLGIDFLKKSICSLDCIYCEVGKTENLTLDYFEYVSSEELIKELANFLPDCSLEIKLTFGGSGEPTLNPAFVKVIDYLNEVWPDFTTVILTNGTTMSDPVLCRELQKFDIVIPSLDAGTKKIFELINRPHKDIIFEDYIYGLIEFSQHYKGELWLETFVVPGINDGREELEVIRKIASKIKYTIYQVNTLHRPGTEKQVKTVNKAKLKKIAEFLGAELIEHQYLKVKIQNCHEKDIKEKIMNYIQRRPATIDDLFCSIGCEKIAISNELERLMNNGDIVKIIEDGHEYYKVDV